MLARSLIAAYLHMHLLGNSCIKKYVIIMCVYLLTKFCGIQNVSFITLRHKV